MKIFENYCARTISKGQVLQFLTILPPLQLYSGQFYVERTEAH